MNELQKAAAKVVVKSNSTTRGLGTGLMVVGAGGTGLAVLAALVPFVGVLGLSITLLVLGLIVYLTA